MYGRIILNIVLIFSVIVVQVAFISGLPGWFGSINLVIVTLIFILALSSFSLALLWSVGFGLLLDIDAKSLNLKNLNFDIPIQHPLGKCASIIINTLDLNFFNQGLNI